MKKKTIEKIPYLTGKKCNKKSAKYVAAVQIKKIENEPHLFLEIYENKARSLKVPVYRFVYTKKDWGNFIPEDGKWSSCSIINECDDQIWNIGKERVDKEKGTYIEQKDIEKIKKFTKKSIWNEIRWWEFLERLEDEIKHERWKKRQQKRQELLNARCGEIKALPKNFEKWYEEELFKGENFIYYKRKGRYATFWCSHCGESYTYATEQKDTYEGQFEKVVETPRNGNRARCEKCDAVGFYKTAGKAKTVYGLKKMCYVGQKYKENGMVMRYIQIEKILSIGKPEQFIVTEVARSFFEDEKKCITDYHLYNPWTGKDEWCDHNIGGMGAQISENAAAVYTGSYEEMKNTMFRYSGLEEYAEKYEKIKAADYLRTYQRMPIIEMLSKLNLNKIVNKLVEYPSNIYLKNEKARKPDEALGIYSERLKKLVENEGDINLLRILQLEKELGKRWTEDQIEELQILHPEKERIKQVLQWVTLQKFLNRVEKYAGIRVKETCGAGLVKLIEISNIYMDYLIMRNERGYDMKNTVYLFPRDLETAHERMVEEANKKELDKRLKEVEEKYPEIKKNYRKLRQRYYYEDENFIIRPARSAEEIVMEGRSLHHCVGRDNYLDSHNSNRTIILMLRFKEKPGIPYITVEIENTKIIQWYGRNDKKPDEENMKKWLNEYVERLKSEKETEKVLVRIAG